MLPAYELISTVITVEISEEHVFHDEFTLTIIFAPIHHASKITVKSNVIILHALAHIVDECDLAIILTHGYF